MKNLVKIIPLVFLFGCATPLSDNTLLRIQQVAQASSYIGVRGDIIANPQHRVLVENAVKALDETIATGTITAMQLTTIAATLPIKSSTLEWTETGLVVYDLVSMFWYSPNTATATMAIAQGISTGTHLALKSKETTPSLAKEKATPSAIKGNIKSI